MMTNDNDDTEDSPNEKMALLAMKIVTGMIAKHYHVCPVCLTFNMAEIVEAAQEAGLVHHLGPEDPEPETTEEDKDDEQRMAKLFNDIMMDMAGTKH